MHTVSDKTEDAILVVSFGTSYNDSREKTIGAIETAIADAFPKWSVRRAFTSRMIIRKLRERDGYRVDTVEEALTHAREDGIRRLVLQPTHLMDGNEYMRVAETAAAWRSQFDQLVLGAPLLGNENDDRAVMQIITADTQACDDGETAICFMGHGSDAAANAIYSDFQQRLHRAAYRNYYIGTVEADPTLEQLLALVRTGGNYKRVLLQPLMVVAGDHAHHDMAGEEEDSWKSQFTASGNFDSVDTQIAGLGEIEAVQKLYVEHTKKAIESLGKVSKSASSSAVSALEDGTYTAKFNTDSGMFHVNEADNGCGTLTVKDKKMTIHIRLVSKKIVNLFLGSAKDAEKDGAELLQPTTDKVKYSDGTTEEVYGFDVPVEELGKEFDLAILGTKGTWYDHKVSVSDAQKK